jgi:hypothetical protein
MAKKTHKKNLRTLSSRQLFYVNSFLLALSIILLATAIWVQNSAKNPVQPFAGYPAGVTVSMGNAATRVNSTSSATGQGHFTAPADKHYLIVDVTVKNTSEKPINVFPSIDTYVKAPGGKVTFLTPYSLSEPFRAGQVLPGDQISGQLSYLVPKNGSQKLYIDSGWSGGVVTFDVQ